MINVVYDPGYFENDFIVFASEAEKEHLYISGIATVNAQGYLVISSKLIAKVMPVIRASNNKLLTMVTEIGSYRDMNATMKTRRSSFYELSSDSTRYEEVEIGKGEVITFLINKAD